jgi:hypothetical protein
MDRFKSQKAINLIILIYNTHVINILKIDKFDLFSIKICKVHEIKFNLSHNYSYPYLFEPD